MNTPYTPILYSKTGVYTGIHFFLLLNIDRGYSLKPPQLGPQRVPTIYVFSKNMKNITFFHPKISIFTALKYCSILHEHICVMNTHRMYKI